MSTLQPKATAIIQDLLERTFVIIPVLNEKDSLPRVLEALPQVREVIVVDNGSTDGSAEVARQCGATVIDEPRRGYGSACLAGLDLLRTQRIEDVSQTIVGFVDGDFSDHPEQLVQLLEPFARNEADFVIGSRLLGTREQGAMLPQAYFGNKLACFLMWLFFGARYTDLGPFRVIRWDYLEQIGMTDTNFGWTIEMQIKAKKLGIRTVEVPVDYRCRIGTSKISGTILGSLRAGYKIILTIFRYAWTSETGRKP